MKQNGFVVELFFFFFFYIGAFRECLPRCLLTRVPSRRTDGALPVLYRARQGPAPTTPLLFCTCPTSLWLAISSSGSSWILPSWNAKLALITSPRVSVVRRAHSDEEGLTKEWLIGSGFYQLIPTSPSAPFWLCMKDWYQLLKLFHPYPAVSSSHLKMLPYKPLELM